VTLLAAALLGMVQGLTEFLPVSSSAHLILARAFFGWDAGVFGSAFDVACHVGTLLAVVVFFRADIGALVRGIPAALRGPGEPAGRRVWLIAAGTIPIVIVGGLFGDAIELRVRTPMVAATALALGAALLLFIERVGRVGRGEEVLTLGGAVIIGVAQAAALVPGVSRSGATIAAGMALGMRREVAARFTFLMSVPAILAAAVKKGLELGDMPVDAGVVGLFVVGMVTSGAVGYVTVKYFIRFLATNRLDVFAWYRLGLAAVTFAWLAARWG
jgi:undecaprenyl-diphosphatase